MAGGAGAPNLILGPDTSYAGGGGGTNESSGGPGGAGGGGAGAGGNSGSNGVAGTANTGGGGGSGNDTPCGANGGSGIVVVRVPSAKTLAVTPGCNTASTHPGGDKLAKFIASGTLTIS